MRKVVYTLAVDNYFPELCALTFPNHEAYAKKIGAEFKVISERKFPEWHPTYEKLQIFELGRENDWNVHIDADILVSPKFWDVTDQRPDVAHMFSVYDPALYFRPDKYFARDGRQIGVCSAFCAVSQMCHDFWTPFETPYEETVKGINKPHGIDDYCFSRNLARYALKMQLLFDKDEDTHLVKHLSVGGVPTDKEGVLRDAHEILDRWTNEEALDRQKSNNAPLWQKR